MSKKQAISIIGLPKKNIQKALKKSQKEASSKKIKKRRKIDAQVIWDSSTGKKDIKLFNA